MSIKRSHSLSVGVVGLPNVGKSTIFNSLTKLTVPAENFPFCTIDKNVGVVGIPDSNLDLLANHYEAEKVVPSAMTFVDIAGLVKGASKGEGLGNQFLSHIREVDVIMYVLRAFESENIVHVYERINPIEDFEIVQSELILKDIESVEKRLHAVEKLKRSGDEKGVREYEVLEKVMKELNEGIPVIDMKLNEEEQESIHDLFLLTNKKRMFILNYKEGIGRDRVEEWKKELEGKTGDIVLIVDVKFVGEMATMSEGQIDEYVSMLDEKPDLAGDIIKAAYDTLNLLTFYTGSKKECNAWCIQKGATAKESAGAIHTDLEQGFVTADVVNVREMIEAGGWAEAKEKGIVKNVGKEHIIEDGDYMVVLANK
jgi:hypothetical protein